MVATETLSIRPRTDRDCETVASWINSPAELYLFTGPRLHWPLDTAQPHIMEFAVGVSAWALIDDATSDLVGHFHLTFQGDTARLGRVIVDPKRRGHGLAHALVDHAISLCQQLGASSISLNVIVGNEPAIHTYQRAGFVTSGTRDRPDVHTMTLQLGPPYSR